MYPLDLDRLRLKDQAPVAPSKAAKPPRHGKGETFLRGPVPWGWLTTAANLPGKTLHVALVLWQLAGMKGGSTVRWRPAHAEQFGLGRHVVYRGLKALSEAGLVTTEWKRGAAPVVTILPAPNAARGPPNAV